MRRTVPGPVVRPELGACLDCDLDPNAQGYPYVRERGTLRRRLASRVVLEHALDRPIAEGLCALHRCDRTSCVEKRHLYEGTRKQNAADRDARTGNPILQMSEEARHRRLAAVLRGEKHPAARLNEQSVRVLRFLAARGYAHQRLADAHKVRRETVSVAVRRETWAHVADVPWQAAA